MYFFSFPFQESIIDLSEESQLEAAITASLEAADNCVLVFSDDSDTDHASRNPDRNKEDPLHHHETTSGGRRVVKDIRTGGANEMATKGILTRKRLSGSVAGTGREKRMRTDMDPMCKAIDGIELTNSLPEECVGESSNKVVVVNGKEKRGKRGKGRGKAKGKCKQQEVAAPFSDEDVAGCTVDELLARGDIRKEDVSWLLFRLPDGTRCQQSFLCTHPVRVRM